MMEMAISSEFSVTDLFEMPICYQHQIFHSTNDLLALTTFAVTPSTAQLTRWRPEDEQKWDLMHIITVLIVTYHRRCHHIHKTGQ